MPADPNAVESLFHRARALLPADRAALLAACDDPAVRAKVERLLAAEADLDATADPPTAKPTATSIATSGATPDAGHRPAA
ncbi:MAG TPA: hypothetical protein VMZ71_08805, partial [Gemmataceae bacterium]|nr:hypothetical protein [Gemmataceae bacterium]